MSSTSPFTRPMIDPVHLSSPGYSCLHLQVKVRMWGQFFTNVVWEGVLSALRAAPPKLLSGQAGWTAGVPSLLEAFLNLVAVQVRGGRRSSRVPHLRCLARKRWYPRCFCCTTCCADPHGNVSNELLFGLEHGVATVFRRVTHGYGRYNCPWPKVSADILVLTFKP